MLGRKRLIFFTEFHRKSRAFYLTVLTDVTDIKILALKDMHDLNSFYRNTNLAKSKSKLKSYILPLRNTDKSSQIWFTVLFFIQDLGNKTCAQNARRIKIFYIKMLVTVTPYCLCCVFKQGLVLQRKYSDKISVKSISATKWNKKRHITKINTHWLYRKLYQQAFVRALQIKLRRPCPNGNQSHRWGLLVYFSWTKLFQ